jgi:hypothetical protein
VYKLDTLPHKAWISWSYFARCFPEEMLVSNHLTTTEQCQVAGGPFWDDANEANFPCKASPIPSVQVCL